MLRTNDNGLSKNEVIKFFLFLLLAFLWSGSFINIKIVVEQFPSIFCAMMRVLVSLLTLSIIFALRGKKVFFPAPKYWRLWLAGFFTQALPFGLLFFGERFITPGLTSIINSTVSIWALILGTLIFGDLSQWTFVKIAGIISGLIGILLVFLPFIHGSENSLVGIVALIGMAIAYAVGGLVNQHVIFKNEKVCFEENLIQQHLSSVLFLILTSLTVESWPSWSRILEIKTVMAFLYLGVMATAFAWMIYFHLIKEWGAVRAASVMYLVPVLAILWDLLFLHLMPTSNELLGMLAILMGVTLIQWRRRPVRAIERQIDFQVKKA